MFRFIGHIVKLVIYFPTAELDATDMYGVTSVHLAAEFGHLECLRLLLEAGASCNVNTAFKRPQWVSTTGRLTSDEVLCEFI